MGTTVISAVNTLWSAKISYSLSRTIAILSCRWRIHNQRNVQNLRHYISGELITSILFTCMSSMV